MPEGIWTYSHKERYLDAHRGVSKAIERIEQFNKALGHRSFQMVVGEAVPFDVDEVLARKLIESELEDWTETLRCRRDEYVAALDAMLAMVEPLRLGKNDGQDDPGQPE